MWRKFIYWPYSICQRGRVCWDSAGMGCWQLPFLQASTQLALAGTMLHFHSNSTVAQTALFKSQHQHMQLASSHAPHSTVQLTEPTGKHSLHTGCPLSARLRLTGRTVFLDPTNPNKCKESSRNNQKLGASLSTKAHLPHGATPWDRGDGCLHDTQRQAHRVESKGWQRARLNGGEKASPRAKPVRCEYELDDLMWRA